MNFVDIARRAAQLAGGIIRNSGGHTVTHKGAVDLVTEVDLACERAIVELLGRETPAIAVVGEEGADGDAPLPADCWIVDPLDGTTNFVHGYPSYGVSVALQLEGRVQAACVYDAVRDQTFCARRGHGADRDGQPLRVSTTPSLDTSLLGSGFPYDRRERAAFYLAYFQAFMERCQGVRRAGAAAIDLAWVAEGRLDGFWEFNLQPWDIAAGALLVEEAGGRVTGMDDRPIDLRGARILASNGLVHDAMLEVIDDVSAALRGSIDRAPRS